MEDIVIEVENVSKVYKLYANQFDRLKEAWSISKRKSYHTDYLALKKIDFAVHRGECIGIIGTNGSGKSTLLQIITGVLSASEGKVSVTGRISALLELGAGFNMEYTGIKNIYLNGSMMGYTRAEMDERVEAIVEFAEIGDYINQPVKTYSSGMFARLAFAVAINIDPDILIVDEALSVGDIFFQAKCYKKFTEFQEAGKTILFVSHDMGSILKYCNRCLLINRGKQIAYGNTKEVVDMYRKILLNNIDESESNAGIDSGGNADTEEMSSISVSTKESLWKDKMLINPNCVEYGDGKAHIIDFGIADQYGVINDSVSKGEEFTINFKVKFQEYINHPIFAYTIKDLKGTDITGTNSMLEENNLEYAEKGDTITVSFKQYMNLQGGQYLLSIACTGYEGDTFVVHHRLYDVCNIHVVSEKNTIGFFDMRSNVSYL